MKQPTEYLQLASHFEAAADANPDQDERQNLRARIYFALASNFELSGSKGLPLVNPGGRK